MNLLFWRTGYMWTHQRRNSNALYFWFLSLIRSSRSDSTRLQGYRRSRRYAVVLPALHLLSLPFARRLLFFELCDDNTVVVFQDVTAMVKEDLESLGWVVKTANSRRAVAPLANRNCFLQSRQAIE